LERPSTPTPAHGDDDPIVPIARSPLLAAKLVRNPVLKIFPGDSHSLGDPGKDKLNADLLAIVRR